MDDDRLAFLMRRMVRDMREVNTIIQRMDMDEWQKTKPIFIELMRVNAQLLLKLAGVSTH